MSRLDPAQDSVWTLLKQPREGLVGEIRVCGKAEHDELLGLRFYYVRTSNVAEAAHRDLVHAMRAGRKQERSATQCPMTACAREAHCRTACATAAARALFAETIGASTQ